MENSFIHTKISIEEVFPDAFPILKREQYYKLSESEGLLHAVQKIIFDEWSDQLREQVHKNCLEDLCITSWMCKNTYFIYGITSKMWKFHLEFSTRYSKSKHQKTSKQAVDIILTPTKEIKLWYNSMAFNIAAMGLFSLGIGLEQISQTKISVT